jgi:hypothetical protein
MLKAGRSRGSKLNSPAIARVPGAGTQKGRSDHARHAVEGTAAAGGVLEVTRGQIGALPGGRRLLSGLLRIRRSSDRNEVLRGLRAPPGMGFHEHHGLVHCLGDRHPPAGARHRPAERGHKLNPKEVCLMLTAIGFSPVCLSTRTVTLHPIGKSAIPRVGGTMMRTPPLSRMASVSTASSTPAITVCGMGAAAYPTRDPKRNSLESSAAPMSAKRERYEEER